MRMADRPHGEVILLPHERPEDYRGLKYPGVHSFRAGRVAAKAAYQMAGITNPLEDLDFIELHDAYTSSEVQTYEDMGLCRYGEGGKFVERGTPFMPAVDYGYHFPEQGRIPINPSGGLIACGHPVGATGIMQGVFALWQLQGSIRTHFGSDVLQVRNARRGAIHSHAGTGTYVVISILERGD
jgi:acetyl-CoA C-acetyltransferase